MNIIIMGPQGSGKGTHAKKLSEKLGIPHISTGDLFREVAEHCTEEGMQIKRLIESGSLVPDEITFKILNERLSMERKGFVLDGFPRNISQAKMFSAKIDRVVYLHVSDEECMRRLGGRRTCRSCGAIYGNENQPKKKGVCDACGGLLYQREDDKDDVIRKRLLTYHEQTEPILDFYRKRDILVEVKVEGIKKPEEVFKDICRALGMR